MEMEKSGKETRAKGKTESMRIVKREDERVG